MSTPALELERLRLHLAAGDGAADLAGCSDRVRRAVALAGRTGAPLLPALDRAGRADADARRADRAVDVACAQARTVAAGLLLAPLLLVPGLGAMLDLDLWSFYTGPVGLGVAGLVLLLLGLGAAVVRALLRRARRPAPETDPRHRAAAVAAAVTVGLAATWVLAPLVGALVARRGRRPTAPAAVDEVADLAAVALTAGLAPTEALREVAVARPDLAADLGRVALDLDLGLDPVPRAPAPLDRVALVVAAATGVGAPVVPALGRVGEELRAEELARALAAAERLPTQLTFPTALCLLPAVLLAIGAPLAYAGLRSTGL